MTTNDKTLADVQPGGRVRLGDQRSDLVPGIVRCAKCSFQLHRTNLYLESGTVGAGDSKSEPCPNGCGPLWPVTWETWAREGWAEAERLHLEKSALSAQPSPSGQENAVHCGKCKGRGYVHVDVDVDDSGGSIGNIEACPHCAIAAPPSPGGQGDALLESLVARWRNHAEEIGVSDNLLCQKIANCTMRHAAELQAVLAARQPVEFERAIPTRRRESAVELLLQLGFVWNNQRWEDRRQPVGEPVEFDYPEFHQEGMGCGLEDRGITDRYEAMRYGFDEALDQMATILASIGPLYAAPPAQAVDLAENMLSVLIEEGVLARNGRVFQKLRALIDSMAVGK